MVQMEMSLESRVTSHESNQKTNGPTDPQTNDLNLCGLCVLCVRKFRDGGWFLNTQIENLCVLSVFLFFSVLSVVNLRGMGWVFNKQTKNLCFSLCALCFFSFSVLSVVNFFSHLGMVR